MMLKLQPDEEKFIEGIKYIDEIEPDALSKTSDISVYMKGFGVGHDVYGKDKPVGPLMAEILDLRSEHFLGEYDIVWADIMRAVERRIKESEL